MPGLGSETRQSIQTVARQASEVSGCAENLSHQEQQRCFTLDDENPKFGRGIR
jgi:hypothetical protein